jgi:hypothetical protein
MSSLLAPIALMIWALGGWCVLANMGPAAEFVIPSGLFSHWQVWIALGLGIQFAAFLLGRPAEREIDASEAAPLRQPATRGR